MRSVICSFATEAEFVQHVRWGNSCGASLAFVGTFDLEEGAAVNVTVIISNVRERCSFRMNIVGRRHFGIDDKAVSSGRVWRYEAVVSSEDAVWLDAFRSRVETVRGFDLAAA